MMPLPSPTRSIRPRAKRLRAGLRHGILALFIPLSASHALALDESEWSHRQEFTVEATGLVKFALPAETLDGAALDLADLRVLDTTGRETPYALVRPAGVQPKSTAPRNFRAELTDSATTLTIETGTTQPLVSVTVSTPANAFIKPVRIELSADGHTWETVADSIPLFRQNGAEQLTFTLPHRPSPWVRLTVDDRRSPPLAFTGATLLAGEVRPAATEPVEVRVLARDELPGETVLTLDLGAAHLPLTSLQFTTDDPLFTRAVTVTHRELTDESVVERTITRGVIYRVAMEGLAPASNLTLPLFFTTPTRELIVHIDNGDSPPLTLTGLRGERRPVSIVFNASASGVHTLLMGRPHTAPPRYDLPPFSGDFEKLPTASIHLGKPTPNPGYRRAEALANVDIAGAPLDPQGWAWRKTVRIDTAGVQQLELDSDVLADARRDLADLRLIRAGHQLPYLIEHTSLVRPLPLVPVAVHDPKQPRLSRWELKLPRSGLPLTRITMTSPTGLFQRRLRLYERVTDDRGYTREITLSESDWRRTPGRPGATLSLALSTAPQTDTLWLETDNGDNPPISISVLQAWHPVTRLLFKTGADDAPALYYGQPRADAPRYDLGLVAGQLFTAEKHAARLGAAEALTSGGWTPTAFMSRRSGILFWGALVLVVGLLLFVVVRLLPNPPA